MVAYVVGVCGVTCAGVLPHCRAPTKADASPIRREWLIYHRIRPLLEDINSLMTIEFRELAGSKTDIRAAHISALRRSRSRGQCHVGDPR